ncbi:MAG: DUF2442 domain-containing protein [Planctomycetaceae bacterium]
MNPRVKAVTATDDYKLDITFTNGEVGTFDCTPLLGFGVFKEFRELDYFKRAFVDGGTVVWPHEQDICPDTLYEKSMKPAAQGPNNAIHRSRE